MKYVIALLVALFASPLFAAYPYDAVGNVATGGSGTMVYVEGNQGLVITSAHVVPFVSETVVTWGRYKRVCKVVHVDYANDLAVLVCKNPPVKAVPHRKTVGNFIVSAGYPFYERSALHWQASIALKMEGSTMWVTHRPVAGMSGGAAFDCGGYLVGVVKCHDDFDGGCASGPPFLAILQKYRSPLLWIPNDSHVKKNPKYNYSPTTNVEIRSIKYNEETAPELPWPGK